MITQTPRLLNPNLPCYTCKYYGDEWACEQRECDGCDNTGKDFCHCLEFVPVEETTCPYYKENEVEE